MKVSIKDLGIPLEVKSRGVEFEVSATTGNGGGHLGDLVLTSTQIIWCTGRTRKENGVKIPWDTFIKWAEAQK